MANEHEETIIDSTETNEAEEVVEELETETQETETNEDKQEVQEEKPQETPEAKYARLTRQAKQLEKKYGFKQEKSEVKVEQPTTLAPKDVIALTKANIHEEDIDEVLEYAKYKKISVADALKSGVIKATLAEKQEHRATAQATNTGKTRSGSQKVSGDVLLKKAKETGEVPESDAELDALIEARYKR